MKGVTNINFLENIAYVLNDWFFTVFFQKKPGQK